MVKSINLDNALVIALGTVEQLERNVGLLQQRIVELEAELVVAEEACMTATKRKATEWLKRGTEAKKNKNLQKKVRRLEQKDAAQSDQIDALHEARVPKSSPTKRIRVSKIVRQNIQRWAEENLKRLLKRYGDPAKVNEVVTSMYALLGQPDNLLSVKSKLSTAFARSRETLCDLLPEGFLSKEHATAAQQVVDKIQLRWSTGFGNRIKSLLHLSRRKYMKLRDTLSTVLDPTTGLHVPFELPHGTIMPTIPTYYRILKKKLALRAKYNVNLDNDTKAVQLDVELKMRADVEHSLSKNLFVTDTMGELCSTKDGRQAECQVMMDACYLCKGLSCTNIGYKFPNGSLLPNSPSEWKTVCLLEGSDKWASVVSSASTTLEGFNKLMQGETTGPRLTMKWLGGGDMASIASSLALNGCASPCPCPMCEVPRTELCELDLPKTRAYTKRTINRILLLAHVIEGKCPGCKYNLVKVVTKKDKEMKLAQPGDEQPSIGPRLKGRGLTWLEMHFGVAYGKYPLYKSIDPSDWISCILHLNLRIVGGLMTKTIYDQIDKNKVKGEKQEEAITVVLKQRQIYVRTSSLAPKSKNVTKAKADFKQHSFSGKDAETLLFSYLPLLNVVCSPEARAGSAEVEDNYQHRKAAWERYSVVWKLINTVQVDWTVWGDEVETAAKRFLESWVAAIGGNSKGVYLHVLMAHIPDLIRKYGDLNKYASHGLEHTHKLLKQFAPLGTNFKPGQRGRSQLDQLLAREQIAREEDTDEVAQEFEKERKARHARALRKVIKFETWEAEMKTML